YGPSVGAMFRAKWRNVIDTQIVPAGVPPPCPGEAEQRYFTARSLTAMRCEMNQHTRARVLLGGRAFGFEGRYPGLVEEAWLAMSGENPQPVYLIGAFGGASRAVIDALEGEDTAVLAREQQERADPGYRAMAAVYDREAAAGRADPIDYPG